MPKRNRKSSSHRARQENSCCPIVRVKCRMKREGGGAAPAAAPSLMQRLAKFKENERKAYASLGGIGDVRDAMRHGGSCTVKVGVGKARRMNATAAGKYVANIVAAQKKRRCVPHVVRG